MAYTQQPAWSPYVRGPAVTVALPQAAAERRSTRRLGLVYPIWGQLAGTLTSATGLDGRTR
jgi:hypothetical protein